jgi:hypothetical protein
MKGSVMSVSASSGQLDTCGSAESHESLPGDEPSSAPKAQDETSEGAAADASGGDQAGEDALEEFSLDDIEIIESKVFA